jgi:hypothetical protein
MANATDKTRSAKQKFGAPALFSRCRGNPHLRHTSDIRLSP